ncbi:MAG: condensation domain-containing protein [Dissulfurispiraceae bacterium]
MAAGWEYGVGMLAAYVVSRGEVSVAALREHLGRIVPGYMIPAYIVKMEELPLTPNGKIDRKALPDPGTSIITLGRESAGPGNEIEEKLTEIWETVLGRKNIGIHDNYFALGGDSIKAIQTASRLNQSNLKLEIKDIFRYPTIAELACRVLTAGNGSEQGPISGPAPLTAIQEWFFREHKEELHHFNQAVTLYSKAGLREDALRAAFGRIQEHHDALRMRYRFGEGEIIQENAGLECPLHFEVRDLRGEENAAAILAALSDELQSGMKLESGPLMKAMLFRLADGDRLLIVVHHLVIDGVSWRIVLDDLALGYRQYCAGEEIRLPAKTASFKRWAEEMRRYAAGPALEVERDYWKAVESYPVRSLEKDFTSRGQENSRFGDMAGKGFALTIQETASLLGNAHRAYNTEINDLLLTALSRAVKQWRNMSRLFLSLEGHGREELFDGIDISRTVGWFTSLYPVLLELPDTEDLGRQIKQVKETLRRAPNKGVGYGVLKYLSTEGLPPVRGPHIVFNYLGRFDEDFGGDIFSIAEETAGNAVSPAFEAEHDLCISGIVLRGRLDVSVSFNRLYYKPDTIDLFITLYESELKRIIGHCLSRESTEITPSDIDYEGLSIDELDKVLEGLGG